MLCRVAAVKSPRTSSYRRLYFSFFRVIEPTLVILKIKYPLSRRFRSVCVGGGGGGGGGCCRGGGGGGACAASQTSVLHVKRLNQTDSPNFFVILCVLCFQRQSFQTFILNWPGDYKTFYA